MFKDNVLNYISNLMCNDFQYSVSSDIFEHSHTFIQEGYRIILDISSFKDLTIGKIVPKITISYYTLDMKREATFTLTHTVFYSNNGKGYEGNFTLNEEDSVDKLIQHGYTNEEIEIIKNMRFSINIYISKQQ